MFALGSVTTPAVRRRTVLACMAALIAPSLSGCSSTNSQASYASNGPAVMSWRLFDEPQAPRPVKIAQDLEDDGIAAQTPPPKSIRLQKDDPTQPWSPNYGRVHDGVLESVPAAGAASERSAQAGMGAGKPAQVAVQEAE